jgi:hypothetical protein
MNKVWKISCLVAMLVIVGSVFGGMVCVASASTEQIKSPSEIVNAVKTNGHHIPTSWNNSEPGQPFLLHKIVDGEIIPFYWVVPFEQNGEAIGLIGLDPYTAEFGWGVKASGKLVKPSRDVLKSMGYDSQIFSLEKAKLVYIGPKDGSCWAISKEKAPISEYLFYQIKDQGRSELKTLGDFELDKESNLAGIPSTATQSPVVKLTSLKESTVKNMQYTITSTDKSSTYWMYEAVPYYDQEDHPWCALYCLAMHHQWFSPISLGSGKNQAKEIATYLKSSGIDSNVDDGTSIIQLREVMEQWEDMNGDYENYQITYVPKFQRINNHRVF